MTLRCLKLASISGAVALIATAFTAFAQASPAMTELTPARPPGTDRHRPPRRQRLSSRAHAGGLPPGDPPGRRLHRTGPGGHTRRRTDRAPRERDLRHDRRRRASRVRQPPHHQDRRWRGDDRLVHRGLHARRNPDAAREGAHSGDTSRQHALRRPLHHPDLRRSRAAGQAREPRRTPHRRLSGNQASDVLRHAKGADSMARRSVSRWARSWSRRWSPKASAIRTASTSRASSSPT